MNYYNEIDPFAAEWLWELIKAGHIAPGIVDTRSIEDVKPSELAGFTQCHFFAGIGVWSYALRQAGWPDDRPIWTGSCPCQPFSAAGKGGGFDDERHLWPSFAWLIEQCAPPVVFGEQVASKATGPWFDLVQADLEAMGYAFGLVPFPSAGVGAPHIRDRAYWVADSAAIRLSERVGQPGVCRPEVGSFEGQAAFGNGVASGLANHPTGRRRKERAHSGGGIIGDCPQGLPAGFSASSGDNGAGPTNGFWRNADWLGCRDGKFRPVEPAFKQMVDGLACAMVYLRDARTDKEKIEEVKNAAAEDTRSEEILRAMRGGATPEALWIQTGGQVGFYEATLLFAFLLEHEGQLGHFIDCASQGGSKACENLLREMRPNGTPARTSSGRKHSQQPPKQFADALSELPQADALEVIRSLNGSPLANGSPARVGRLRGYGNAINAEAAKAFISAYMECQPH